MHPIARYRRIKGWTQTDLVERLGVAMYTVQRWEKGTLPRPKVLPQLAEALGADPARLLDELVQWAEEGKEAA